MSSTASAHSDPIPEPRSIEELVGRDALRELCRSAFELFGVSVRVFSARDALLADVHRERAICAYVNGFPSGRKGCTQIVARVSGERPESHGVTLPCFTGARYLVEPIVHGGRPIGRLVLGPFRDEEDPLRASDLATTVPEADPNEAARKMRQDMPLLQGAAASRIATHLRRVLELLAFSGHRALASQQLQVASVRESYRELAEQNERLERAYARLEELDRLKSNFLATISHELRTPLTSILGYAEMLASGLAGALNEEQLDFARTIHAKGEQLLRLISHLLDLAKLEQGAVRLACEPVDVPRLLEELHDTLRPRAEAKGVHLEVSCACTDRGHVIHADEVALGQVLTNLADNAIKFTPQGGRVRVLAQPAQMEESPNDDGERTMGLALFAVSRPAVEFVVQDTGIGIPEEAQARIFDAFYQVDGSSTRAHQGAGLGLSIVKRLVDAMGGRIEVDSTPGEGTRFRVLVPDAPPNTGPE